MKYGSIQMDRRMDETVFFSLFPFFSLVWEFRAEFVGGRRESLMVLTLKEKRDLSKRL
jgi:hypothetical protein